MCTRLVSLVIDATDPAAAARFWYIMLGGTATPEPGGCRRLLAPDVGGSGLDLLFTPATAPKSAKNRIHLDLATESPHEYQVLTSLAADVGAREVEVGQGADVPWTVFHDPEGNEFCILEPDELYARTGPLAALVVDSAAPSAMAEFWSEATGWPLAPSGEDGAAALRSSETSGPWLEFLPVPDVQWRARRTARRGGNRIRFDVTTDGSGADLDRLLELGATELSERDANGIAWLADPEGNEFRLVPTHVRA
ncbi:VOC family protein [Actinokineospora sp. G85]|uniref:VOC family protein n=1 Tax=Actinokineospora sp. G85 TaxID=3406626 RepID=UPI003C746B5D